MTRLWKIPLFIAFLVALEAKIIQGAASLPRAMPEENIGTVATIGRTIFDLEKFVIPFEILAFLLLSAMIGAIILAKEEKG